MNKAFLKKTVSAVVVAATITTLSPLGVSAQWRQNTDSTWNYIEGNSMIRGWKKISDTWYHFNPDGNMNTGWIYDNGTWYYNNDSGAMQTGWINDDGIWYYLDNSGAMRIGWIKDKGKWYYADSTGAMQTGIVKIANKKYYFNKSCQLQTVNNGSEIELSKSENDNFKTNGQDLSEKDIDTTDSVNTNVNVLPELPQNYDISVQDAAENKILELMNQKRKDAGLQPVTMENALLQVARYKSNHMIQYNYFDHSTPEGSDWTSWLKLMNYKYTTTGENIAYNTYDPVELFNQWWNSSGHRENMMNASYTKVGIGVIYGNGKYMGTQEFSN